MINKNGLKSKGILLESGTNEVEFLEFVIGNQNFGVNVAKVTQALVWKDQELTKLPQASSYSLGTVPFRKKHIPVIDLKSYLGIYEQAANPDKQLLLVMEFNRKSNGYVVDGVEEIQRVSWDKFVPFTDTAYVQGDPCIIGTVTIDNRVIMILDMEGMMAQLDNSLSMQNYAKEIQPTEVFERSKVRILYCEDSPIIQKITTKILLESGFQDIKVFNTGQAGLEYLMEPGNGGVDIILSDIEMPQLDGLALCKIVKNHKEYSNIPFVFFSSLINEQMKKKCDALKADAAFSKPEINQIVSSIEALCKQYQKGFVIAEEGTVQS
jgi:two-component system chemotaxis response regulator CheV